MLPEPARSESTTPEPDSQEPRFKLYALCPCPRCDNTGRYLDEKCSECRGEGKVRTLVAEADDEAGVGVALVTCAREGAWDGCQLGLLDTEGAVGLKWLVRPWAASPTARNVSDAARVLQARKRGN